MKTPTLVQSKKQATNSAVLNKKEPSANAKTIPLIIEPYPQGYSGLPFLTLIHYRRQSMLTIVDNADAANLKVFVLDLCGPERVDEAHIISIANDWYNTNREKYPLSIEFSRRGLISQTSKIYRTLNAEFVSRVIGPVPKFVMESIKSVKRRRRKTIPAGVEVKITGNVLHIDKFPQ